MTSFKDGFKRARKGMGLTQEQFANKYHFTLASVKKWEQGKATPEADTLALLCEIFNCDMSYLFNQIDLRTHDLQYVHDMTGLSHEAIEYLVGEKTDGYREMRIKALNFFLTSVNFENALIASVMFEKAEKEAQEWAIAKDLSRRSLSSTGNYKPNLSLLDTVDRKIRDATLAEYELSQHLSFCVQELKDKVDKYVESLTQEDNNA